MTPAEYLKALDVIRIATYALCSLPLASYIALLGWMLYKKDRRNLTPLIIVCVLMILYLAAVIVMNQLWYTFSKPDGDLTWTESQIINGCYFIVNATFYLAHWVFAYSYLALSFRLELAKNKRPENTYNRLLNTVNAIVCLLNVAILAVYWVLAWKEPGVKA